MRSAWERIRHAFAVEAPGPAEPTPEQQRVIDRVCWEVVRRRLGTPVLMGIEMSRPLNYVAAQGLHFVAPGVWAVVGQQTYEDYRHFAEFLEQRRSADYVVARIEHFEAEQEKGKRAGTTG